MKNIVEINQDEIDQVCGDGAPFFRVAVVAISTVGTAIVYMKDNNGVLDLLQKAGVEGIRISLTMLNMMTDTFRGMS
jgi:hypothetical protein